MNTEQIQKTKDSGNNAEPVERNIFVYCSAALVLLMFINLGTVLDLKRLKSILKLPIGPFIGFCSRYLIMPALAIGIGRLLLQDNNVGQLALFFTAILPSGGLANICTIFLKGNINLSLTITMVNGLLGLAMLSFWILVIMPHLYHESFDIKVPFVELTVSAIALIAAISFGLILRITIPKTTLFIFRFIKPFSIFLSVALIAVTVGLNFFVFKDLTLNILIAVFLLPFIGYLLSFGFSKLFRRSFPDAMTIAIETSVLSMTVPILLLRKSFNESQMDLIIVIPIVSSLISIGLIFILYVVRRAFGWNVRINNDCFDEKVLLIET